MHQQHQFVLPGGVARGDGIAQRQAFKLDPGLRQRRQLVPLQGRHTEAALVGPVDQTFGRQAAEGLAQGAGTDLVTLADGFHA